MGLSAVVAAAALVTLLVGAGNAAGHPSGHAALAATTTPTTATTCGTGIRGLKCRAGVTVNPPPAQPPIPVPAATTISTDCGQTFFSAATRAALQAHFGMSTMCLRPKGSDQWIVVQSDMTVGTSATPPLPDVGGAFVALLACTGSDATCLDPTATHSFTAFTVYYMPDPTVRRAQVQMILDTHLLDVYDCGVYDFDTLNHTWYPGLSPYPKELQAGSVTTVPTVAAPPPVTAAQALADAAPSATPTGAANAAAANCSG